MRRSSFLSFLDWSVRVGRLFGIPIDLHITLLFFLWPVLAKTGVPPWYALEYAVAIVFCILLHELGHALTAKRYGLTGLSITLHGFGGFAMSSGARTPRQDLLIVLAGPAVTFAIGILAFFIGDYLWKQPDFGDAASVQFYLLRYLGIVNLIMGVLNLVPSLPWDGGQALRAILTHRIPEFKAMRIVGHLGLVVTPPLFLYGLISGEGFVTLFAIVGFLTSLMTLLNSGGVKFREPFDDRKARRDMEALKVRERARTDAYLDEVQARTREREEKERLRRLLEGPSGED